MERTEGSECGVFNQTEEAANTVVFKGPRDAMLRPSRGNIDPCADSGERYPYEGRLLALLEDLAQHCAELVHDGRLRAQNSEEPQEEHESGDL